MNNKMKMLIAYCIALVSVFILVVGVLLFEKFPSEGSIVLLVLSIAAFIFGIAFCVCVERSVIKYKCPKCGNEFDATLKAYLLSLHVNTTRLLKCPECGQKSWCKGIYSNKDK